MIEIGEKTKEQKLFIGQIYLANRQTTAYQGILYVVPLNSI